MALTRLLRFHLRSIFRLILVSLVNPFAASPWPSGFALTQEQIKQLNNAFPDFQNMYLGGRLAECEAEKTLYAVLSVNSVPITIPWNCELVDMSVIPTAVQAGGTVQLKTAGGAAAITDAIACAAVGVVGRMGAAATTPANMVFTAGQVLQLAVAGAATAGKVTLNFKLRQTAGGTNTDGT